MSRLAAFNLFGVGLLILCGCSLYALTRDEERQ